MSAPETDAERCLSSLAFMLGWQNLPPQKTLEADLRFVKKRSDEYGELCVTLGRVITAFENWRSNPSHERQGILSTEIAEAKDWLKAR